MTIDAEQLRIVMREWATGVTVVTSLLEGKRHGMTVNSFTSISLTPPLVLVSIERTTRTHGLVEKSRILGVSILSEGQRDVSDCFAGRTTDLEDRFEDFSTHTLETGCSFIDGGLAFLDCRVVSQFEAGTHTLFIAEVVAVETATGPDPLIYFNRAYHRLGERTAP